MLKRLWSLLLALLMMCSASALAEENVYDLIESALYRIVLRGEEGDETLGSGVLFSDKKLLLTSSACAAEGELYAIGPDGEHAITGAELLDISGAALLEMATASQAMPLHLAAENASGMAALFSVDERGEIITAPLEHVRVSMYEGQSVMLASSVGGLLPGSIITDDKGNLIGLTIAQQAEGAGEYITLDASNLYRAMTRQQYAGAFLPAQAAWKDGFFTVSWEDEKRDSGVYIITLSGEDNQYFTYFEADHSQRSLSLTLPPEHRYDYQVQWAEELSAAIEPVWGAMNEAYIPGAVFNQYGFTQENGFVTRKNVASPLNHVEQISMSMLTDETLTKSLHVKAKYDVEESVELPMTIELIAPDGQFFFESAVHTLTPKKEQEDAFLLPLDDLFQDCAEFSGGDLRTGDYLVRYAIAGARAGEYAFTLTNREAAPQEEKPLEITEKSGFITDVEVRYANGAVTLTWDGSKIPDQAAITVYYMFAGNSYYVYHREAPGTTQTEIYTVPGRETVIWLQWSLEDTPAQEPENRNDLILVPAAQEAAFTLNGFENQRLSLVLSDDPYAVDKGEYLPEVPLTRENLMNEELFLYFQTEDVYQVAEASDEHPMMLALCTPEGLCFFQPLMYLFDPALQESDMWLVDLTSLSRDYEAAVCGAWTPGDYRLMYCIDGQIAGEYLFTLE